MGSRLVLLQLDISRFVDTHFLNRNGRGVDWGMEQSGGWGGTGGEERGELWLGCKINK